MATVTEVLKEKALGTEVEPQLSAQTRNNFLQYAKKDEGSDEYYMTESEFVDAIAPEGEDYVCLVLSIRPTNNFRAY
jgi:solute carrier family 25 aspartate/glutamate transporter 12/13